MKTESKKGVVIPCHKRLWFNAPYFHYVRFKLKPVSIIERFMFSTLL